MKPLVTNATVAKAMLAVLTSVVFFLRCDDDSPDPVKPTCGKEISVAKTLPDRNPTAAPVWIKGKGFSNNATVLFKDIPAETNFINDSTLTTRVPGELKATVGQVKLLVVDGACKDSTEFTITPGFEDAERASPPDIFIPDKSQLAEVSIQDSLYEHFGYLIFYNVWGYRQEFTIDSYSENVFSGFELVMRLNAGYEYNTVTGTYDPDTKVIELTITDEDDVTYNYAGGFYPMTLLTRNGQETGTFLYLESTTTGRQHIFQNAP